MTAWKRLPVVAHLHFVPADDAETKRGLLGDGAVLSMSVLREWGPPPAQECSWECGRSCSNPLLLNQRSLTKMITLE